MRAKKLIRLIGLIRLNGGELGVAKCDFPRVTSDSGEASGKVRTRNEAVTAAQAYWPAGWEACEPSFAKLWCGHGWQGCRLNPQARKPAQRGGKWINGLMDWWIDGGRTDLSRRGGDKGNEEGREIAVLQEETGRTERSRKQNSFSVGSVSSCSISAVSAFTMIEIAISLAIIGFALVAIIGILPAGMNVQKDNRQETIINQDMSVLLNAIRNGEQGLDDLTNYVRAITNFQTRYSVNGIQGPSVALWYTYSNGSSGFALTNGYRIVGILSTPKFTSSIGSPATAQGGVIFSNYIVAFMRSMSGPAQDKAPQANADVLDLAFNYRVATEVVPFSGFDYTWTNFNVFPTNTLEWTNTFNYRLVALTMQTNLYDIRLLFRWPLTSGGNTGNGRQIYRAMASGNLASSTNDGGALVANWPGLYFFQPRTYVQVGTNYQ